MWCHFTQCVCHNKISKAALLKNPTAGKLIWQQSLLHHGDAVSAPATTWYNKNNKQPFMVRIIQFEQSPVH